MAGYERFYKEVSLVEEEGNYFILLDGKNAKSRLGNPLAVQSKELASRLASEWEQQEERIDFMLMPMTRLQMGVMDMEVSVRQEWIDEVVSYLASDLLCYRAEGPDALIKAQKESWDPFLSHVENKLGLKLSVTSGILNVEQPATSLERAHTILNEVENTELFCVRRITDLTGSAVLAFSILARWEKSGEVIQAAHLDETWQSEQWGYDKEAQERQLSIATDISDAISFFILSGNRA